MNDRAGRAQALADTFAIRIVPTLPPPGSELVPGPGRHARLSAESGLQIYVGGKIFERDARGRITARAGAMPSGWSVRLTLSDVVHTTRSTATASRADPLVLRAQRRLGDPAIAAGIARQIKQVFPGRLVSTDTQSLFAPGALAIVREASIVLPIGDDPSLDGSLLASAARLAEEFVRAAPAGPLDPHQPEPLPTARRGHLRLIQ